MKEYELMVLYHPDLEVNIKPATDKVAKIIDNAKGKIVDENSWGRRKLAYPIKKETHAIYRVYTLELPSEAPRIINDTLNITSEVLRFLLTKVDLKAKAILEKEKSEKDTNGEDEKSKEE